MMSDISIRLDEQEELDFDISINVASNNVNETKDVKVRFIVEDNGINYTFDGYKKEGGGYGVRIPVMEKRMDAGNKSCILEVICNNRYFPAWSGKVNFEKSIKVEAAPVVKQQNTQPEVRVEGISKTFKDPEPVLVGQNPTKRMPVEAKGDTAVDKLDLNIPGKKAAEVHQHVSVKKPKIFRDKRLKEVLNRVINRKREINTTSNAKVLGYRNKKIVGGVRDI
jgi:hypothetical protein